VKTVRLPDISVTHPSQIQAGDIVMRPKKLWVGSHYGTALPNGLIAHTTPGSGKHVGPVEEFSGGKPIKIKRPERTSADLERVMKRAVADIGKPYLPAIANCEHDVTTVHSGTAYSPMLQSVLVGLSIVLALGAVVLSKEIGLRN
jgi:hypothetical protein